MIHHICLQKHITVCDGTPLPFGALALLENTEAVLPELLTSIVPQIGEDSVVVCGEEPGKRMLGRKLEDILKREVFYE